MKRADGFQIAAVIVVVAASAVTAQPATGRRIPMGR
jgi:hypothetical protein